MSPIVECFALWSDSLGGKVQGRLRRVRECEVQEGSRGGEWHQRRGVRLEDPAYNKLVQLLYFESSRLVLDCIFTPDDKSNLTGPVVGGVHDALRRLRHHWEGTSSSQLEDTSRVLFLRHGMAAEN